MRRYILIIFTLLLISSSLFAKEKEVVNEYLNDVYFANGINTDRGEAQSALTDIIKKQVKESLFNGNEAKMKESVHFKLAYNNTLGVYLDMLEAWQQKKAEHGTFWWAVETFFDVYGKVAKLPAKYATKKVVQTIILESLKASADKFIKEPLLEKAGLKDLVDLISDLKSNVTPKNAWKTLTDAATALEHYDEKVQLDSYKKSIEQEHSVIVVAHSQGNLFTIEAVDKSYKRV